MKIPTRPAPSVPRNDPSRDNYYQSRKPVGQVKPKKKPPPRPPPPKFNNRKPDFTASLIDLSAPLNDYLEAATSTSIQDLSKQSNNDFFKLEPSTNVSCFKTMPISNIDYFKLKPNDSCDFFKPKSTNDEFFKRKPPPSSGNNYAIGNSSFFGNTTHLDLATGTSLAVGPKTNIVAPTIIRAQLKTKRDSSAGSAYHVNDVTRSDIESNSYSPPMPSIPPPSPPNDVYNIQTSLNYNVPHGIALYNYSASHKGDLPLQVNDVVTLLRQINDEWLYGRVNDTEGMFPANFINIRVPLLDLNENFVTALYVFNPETREDLQLVPGQKIKVIKRVSKDWLYGESNGNCGQFPVNFIDHVPANI